MNPSPYFIQFEERHCLDDMMRHAGVGEYNDLRRPNAAYRIKAKTRRMEDRTTHPCMAVTSSLSVKGGTFRNNEVPFWWPGG